MLQRDEAQSEAKRARTGIAPEAARERGSEAARQQEWGHADCWTDEAAVSDTGYRGASVSQSLRVAGSLASAE